MLPLLTICRSGNNCEPCRDRAGGRAWRQSLAVAFELPADAPDFACPHGKPWGYVRVLGLGDLIHKYAEPLRRWWRRLWRKPTTPKCGGCNKRREQLNKLMPLGGD